MCRSSRGRPVVSSMTLGQPAPFSVPPPTGNEAAEPSIALPLGLTLEEASARYVEATVAHCGDNRTEAARRLGLGRNTVTRMLAGRGKR